MPLSRTASHEELLLRLERLESERDELLREVARLRSNAGPARAPTHSAVSLRAAGDDRWDSSVGAPLGPYDQPPAPWPVAAATAPASLYERPAAPPRRDTNPYLPAVGAPAASAAVEDRAELDLGRLRHLRDDELDALPYGLVVVDAHGTVLAYNDTESRMVGLRKERVVGRNFFTDIAPCTRVREFEGRFRAFASGAGARMFETFDFVFRFERETQHVSIYVTPGRQRGTYNLAMLRRRVERAR